MQVPDFIRVCIADPKALSDAGIQVSRAELAQAHDTLRQARANLIEAQAAESELDTRQAALSARIEDLRHKLADKRSLLGITKGKPEAFTTTARRHAETRRDYDFALLALDILIAGERLPAALAVKQGDLAVLQAEREELTRILWRPIAQAAGFDPAIDVILPADTQIASIVRDLGQRDASIDQLQAEITHDTEFIRVQQTASGLLF
jgi:hypothetical protein